MKHKWRWEESDGKGNRWYCKGCDTSVMVSHGNLRPEPYLFQHNVLEDCAEQSVKRVMES